MTGRLREIRRRDDGVVLLLVGLAMVALLLVVAIVIDLGATRADRRNGQLAVDNAASSAGQVLEETNAVTACEVALEYLRLTLDVTAFSGDSCATRFSSPCVEDTGRAPLVATSGDFTVTLEHPVLDGSALMDASGTIGSPAIPVAAPDGDSCNRFGVQLSSTKAPFFGRIGGSDGRRTVVHAVVVGTPDGEDIIPPAFLILERTSCNAIGTLVGESEAGIIVEWNGSEDQPQPGLIHADSNATTGCSGTTQDAFALYGKPNSSPTIVVQSVPDDVEVPEGLARDGLIQTTAVNNKGAGPFPGGINVAPTVADIVSRRPLDGRYNSAANPAISDLHRAAAIDVLASGAPGGFVTWNCAGAPPAVALLYMDCNYSVGGSVTLAAETTHVTISGNLTTGGGDLQMPSVEELVVRGRVDVGNGSLTLPSMRRFRVGAGITVPNNGRLAVNSSSPSTCPDPASGTATVVVFGGDPALDVAGSAALCASTVYLAGPPSVGYAVQEVTTGGSCSALLPCPKTVGNTATGASLSVQGTVLLEAPDEHDERISDPADQGLEDLAFWTEGAGLSQVKSGGVLKTRGVVAGPNSNFELRSPASGQPQEAQFIARRLFLLQGELRMKPTPVDSVPVPVIRYHLIR